MNRLCTAARIYWLLVVLLIGESVAFAECQWRYSMELLYSDASYMRVYSYGWPFVYLRVTESGLTWRGPTSAPPTCKYEWIAHPVWVDLLLFLSTIVAISVAFERWRRNHAFHVSLSQSLGILAGTSIAGTLYIYPKSFYCLANYLGLRPSLGINWYGPLPPWRLFLPFGLACAAFMIIHLCRRIFISLARRIRGINYG
jgi:hypothetical protein